MCNVMEDMRNESLQKGMKEGMEKGTLRILKTDKYALEEILDIYGLSLDEIKSRKTKAGNLCQVSSLVLLWVSCAYVWLA